MELRELQKMTVLKLREEALKHSGLMGVTAMNKEQLVAALAEVFGIDIEAATKAAHEQLATDKSGLKKAIRTLKAQRTEALTAHDTAHLKKVRLGIKQRKRALRRLVGNA